MADAGVTYFINLKKYPEAFARNVREEVAALILRRAKQIVRVDTHNLQNSIRQDQIRKDTIEVSANTAYAAAQEYGRPDLPRYGFTPYMRPSAKETVGNIDKIIKSVQDETERETKV